MDTEGGNMTKMNFSHTTVIATKAIASMGMTLGVISIILNVIFLIGMRLTQERSSSYFRFMWNLSISDILAACSFLSIQIWPNGFFAPINQYSDFILVHVLPYVFRSWPWVFFTSHVLTLTELTVSQYLAVCKPWRYSLIVTGPKVTGMLLIAWALSSLQVFIPLLVVVLLYSVIDRSSAMEALYAISSVEIQIWMAAFILCNLISLTLDICIYRKLRSLKRKRRLSYVGADSLNIRNKHEAFVTVVTLLIASLLCRLPFPLTGLVSFSLRSPVLDAGIVCLLYLNFVVDPIIYLTRLREVRNVYSSLWRSCPLTKHTAQNNDVVSRAEAHNLLTDLPCNNSTAFL